MSWPHISAVPDVGGMKPVIIRMVVDFPAPFGPRNPSTSPFLTSKEIPLTASKEPKLFFRFSTFSMSVPLLLSPYGKKVFLFYQISRNAASLPSEC